MKTATDIFRDEIEAYMARSGLAPTTFGIKALGNPSFVGRFRNGVSPSLDTVDRVRAWMKENPAKRNRSAQSKGAAS